MTFNDIKLNKLVYTTDDDIYQDVINPLLSSSKIYIRGVAYFHCEWIKMSYEGITKFIANGGKMLLLTSVKIDNDEYQAYVRGEEAKINEKLRTELVNRLAEEYKGDKQWILDYLSYMIYNDYLEIRVSINPSSMIHIFHDKLSFFKDVADNMICIHGSLNDSINSIYNQESIDVFSSYNIRESERINKHYEHFMIIWENKHKVYRTLKLPELIKKDIIALGNSLEHKKTLIHHELVKLEPRDYQLEAIEALRKNGWNGILEMATGTGKTLTSLFAAELFLRTVCKKVIIIVAPQIHLLSQWEKNVKLVFPKRTIINCYLNKQQWSSLLFREAKTYQNLSKELIILVSYKTLISDTFIQASKIFQEKIIYIFDECHILGSKKIINKFKTHPQSNKIGLSATPSRWLDDYGNSFIKNAIGDTVYEFNLEKAIQLGKLVPYHYYPQLVELTMDEYVEFAHYTDRIASMIARSKKNEEPSLLLNSILLKRANLVKSASNKIQAFLEIFKDKEKKNTIVYVHNKQVGEMVNILRSLFGLKVHGIIADTPLDQRNKVLNALNNGDIDVIVAIKCLDEGIDIENCKRAYILASSVNPREFIQRRGRVLRKGKDKEFAEIYDFVTIAPEGINLKPKEKEIVLLRELPRVAEFTRLASNTLHKDKVIVDYTLKINILNQYLENNPWGLNKNNQIERSDEDEEE